MKVLVIDDEHAVRYTLTRLLESNGFEVVTASNGRAGMLLMHRERPDMVITDIIMPEQEGLETIKAIRREAPDLKIVAISGGGRLINMDFLDVARQLGADGIIHKPLESQELLMMLSRLLPVPGQSGPATAGHLGHPA